MRVKFLLIFSRGFLEVGYIGQTLRYQTKEVDENFGVVGSKYQLTTNFISK